MCWWLHLVHAATCPPSASVRQASIEDITLSWLRLICPALARRHTGPYARKMSAISSACFGTRTQSSGQALHVLKRAGDIAQRLCRDMGVSRRRA